MENREEQGLGLSPWLSATTSDEFLDRGLEDNPQFPICVAPAIDEIVDVSRQVFTPSVSNRPSSVTGPNNSSGSQLRLTRPQAKTMHTFSRPIDTTIPSSSMAPSGAMNFIDLGGPLTICIHQNKLYHLLTRIVCHHFGMGLVRVGMVKGLL